MLANNRPGLAGHLRSKEPDVTEPVVFDQNAAELFLDGLTKIVVDLDKARTRDAEAVALIGSLAHRMVQDTGQSDWIGLKRSLSADTLNGVIGKLSREIDASAAKGQIKLAYAMQAIAASLVGDRFEDRRIAMGIKLLDDFIAAASDYYVRNAQKPN